ncbi:hypothetical protein SAMN05216215_106152 [Saccharopolyspora shandongensis]|uniref:Uncharacterized protein n=2 Tax=Saccharopolyspora shandongensis TaxID=418495 RepID=A0A1H3S8E6_9PSEU|nr:hypothetical protein SAMN05216215_106152 [Saccharopolyspora shandongensis]
MVTLRHFAWTSKIVGDQPELIDVEPQYGLRRLPVALAEVVGINALAVPVADHAVKFSTRLHELRLLASYLHDTGDEILLREAEFRSSALHIRRFVSESAGMGMLTAVVTSCRRWAAGGSQVHHVDALPTALAKFSGTRVRPDLLFEITPGTFLAGEARGRSGPPPRSVRKDQERRISSLLPWARRHCPVVMTWASFTAAGTTVDLFRPVDGDHGMDGPFGTPAEPFLFEDESESPRIREFRVRSLSDRVLENVLPEANDLPSSEAAVTPPSRPDPTPPSGIRETGRRHLEQLERELWRSAPKLSIRVAGRRCQGQWVRTDLFAEGAGQLFFGVLDEAITVDEAVEVASRLRARLAAVTAEAVGWSRRVDMHDKNVWDEMRVTVAVYSRILVVVDPDGISSVREALAD